MVPYRAPGTSSSSVRYTQTHHLLTVPLVAYLHRRYHGLHFVVQLSCVV
jgi:hypothetical protein